MDDELDERPAEMRSDYDHTMAEREEGKAKNPDLGGNPLREAASLALRDWLFVYTQYLEAPMEARQDWVKEVLTKHGTELVTAKWFGEQLEVVNGIGKIEREQLEELTDKAALILALQDSFLELE
jgi:hypothetical protein